MKLLMVNAGRIRKFSTSIRSLSFAECLTEQGIDVDYVVKFNEEDREIYGDRHKGVNIHYVKEISIPGKNTVDPLILSNWFIFSNRVKALIKKLSPEIIHLFKPLPFMFKSVEDVKGRIPVVLDLDDAEYEMFREHNSYGWLRPFALKKVMEYEGEGPLSADFLTVASRYYYEFYRNKAKGVIYIPNGIFLRDFDEGNIDAVRQKYGLDKRITIAYLGTFQRCFEIDLVIDLFHEIRKESNSTHLLLIGDGPERASIEKLISEKGIKEKVSLTGYLPKHEVPSHLKAADILIFPIKNNFLNRCRCPVKIREYLAAGRPIVSGMVGEVKEAVDDELQLTPAEFNRDEYLRRLRMFIADENLRLDVGLRNRKRAELFEWHQLAGSLAKTYKSLLSH